MTNTKHPIVGTVTERAREISGCPAHFYSEETHWYFLSSLEESELKEKQEYKVEGYLSIENPDDSENQVYFVVDAVEDDECYANALRRISSMINGLEQFKSALISERKKVKDLTRPIW